MPIGFVLTMYTQTGYDASAHTAEETKGAAIAAAQGVWRSVFFSAMFGWVVLLALLFAANDEKAITEGGGGATTVITTALTNHVWAAKAIILIAVVGQIFCVAAGLTSAARTWYAFSRDRGIPGWNLYKRLNRNRIPMYAVLAVSFFSLLITVPALWGNKAGVAWAFGALTAICTVGLYIAYIIPVYLRWRHGDNFQRGPWTLGAKYRWVNPLAMAFVVLVVIAVDLPFSHKAVPWNDDFDVTTVNYGPGVLVLGLIVGIWWKVSAHKRYSGPVRTIETDELGRVIADPEPPAQ
jgi:amino acid transporter